MISENKIPYSDFEKLDLRVGTILEVSDHPKADKLYVLTVDLGESAPRTIVAGLKAFYKKEELQNHQAVFVANLEPAILRGIESNGMILAASTKNKEQVYFISPEQNIASGSKIH